MSSTSRGRQAGANIMSRMRSRELQRMSAADKEDTIKPPSRSTTSSAPLAVNRFYGWQNRMPKTAAESRAYMDARFK